jgi:hypothetical protein
MEDFDSDLSFPSRSKDKHSPSVTVLPAADVAVEAEDSLNYRSTRGEFAENLFKYDCHIWRSECSIS